MGRTSSAVKDKYNAKAYDNVTLRLKKGQKDIIKTHAERQGESLNSFISRAIVNQMEHDLAAREGTYEPRRHPDGSVVLPGFFEDYGLGEGGIILTDSPAGEGSADGD